MYDVIVCSISIERDVFSQKSQKRLSVGCSAGFLDILEEFDPLLWTSIVNEIGHLLHIGTNGNGGFERGVGVDRNTLTILLLDGISSGRSFIGPMSGRSVIILGLDLGFKLVIDFSAGSEHKTVVRLYVKFGALVSGADDRKIFGQDLF